MIFEKQCRKIGLISGSLTSIIGNLKMWVGQPEGHQRWYIEKKEIDEDIPGILFNHP
jgi:hypothetical protein